MALGAALTGTYGLSSYAIRRPVVCENLGSAVRSGSAQVSCSCACASQYRILVKSGCFGSSGGGRDLLRRSHKRRDKLAVFAVAEEGDDGAGVDSGSSSSSSEVDVEILESRLGIGRRARREGGEPKPRPPVPSQPKREKKWEEMSLVEQAWSLYIGEKGALFWLNKLAYASIFIVIGGWIVFRFIGPALGWYQLDSPLLPPDQLLG